MGSVEQSRVQKKEAFGPDSPWEKWGPYVSERSWGTVREDYSSSGDAWSFLPYSQSFFKTYRWGEDGIAGICDRHQVLVLSWAFWNENDPYLKEKLYGVNSHEGNHGEDVKEYYFHLDNTPSHSYMKYLYKYPINRFPYETILQESQRRSIHDKEFELEDTKIFEENEYFDISIEYAKQDPEDICIRVEVVNHSSKSAPFHLLPQLYFRNTWSFSDKHKKEPNIRVNSEAENMVSLIADDSEMDPVAGITYVYKLGIRYLYGSAGGKALFTNNESNVEKLFGWKNGSPYVKDAFHQEIVQKIDSCNPTEQGTKGAFHYKCDIPSQGKKTFLFRFTKEKINTHSIDDVEYVIEKRKKEAEEFYLERSPAKASDEEKEIFKLALSGLLWNKQIYLYDVHKWLQGDNPQFPPPKERERIRNIHWKHLVSKRILLMPDKWEYPWFAAWDLAFHAVAISLVDIETAKAQLWYLLFDQFQHPNGQVPAYEWEFSDLNPPVQAWAAWKVFMHEYETTGKKDFSFLKKMFHKLILNFVWWVNRVDASGKNVFEGGFLGLDNITIIDRSSEIPGGGSLEQSDGTGWMGLFCLMLMRISLELSKRDSDYESMAVKFFEHFVYIAHALHHSEGREVQLWNEEDGFFYDVICFPNNTQQQIKVRSLVGIIPLFAIDSVTEQEVETLQSFGNSFTWFCKNRSDMTSRCVTTIQNPEGKKEYLLTLLPLDRMKRVLEKVWDPQEFRSNYGLRSLSKYYENNRYELLGRTISYEPAEAASRIKGGNSNWRGPLWFPITFLFIDAMLKLHTSVGSSLQIQIAGEKAVTTYEMAEYFANGLISLFTKNSNGIRPIYSESELFQKNPEFSRYILFYEHFHGDSGRGIGSSHQCGWTALVANLIHQFRSNQ